MSNLTKNNQSQIDFEQTGSVITIFCPGGAIHQVDEVKLIEFIEEYELHSTDLTGEEMYNHPTAAEYFDRYPDTMCDAYYKYIIKPTLDFTHREALAYLNGALSTKAAMGASMSAKDIETLLARVEVEYGIKMNELFRKVAA